MTPNLGEQAIAQRTGERVKRVIAGAIGIHTSYERPAP
jgi:hypothetical protein